MAPRHCIVDVTLALVLAGCGASSSSPRDGGESDGGGGSDGGSDAGSVGRDGGQVPVGEYDCWTHSDIDDGVPNPQEPCPPERPFCCFSRGSIKDGWRSSCRGSIGPPTDDPDLRWCWENPPVGSTFDCLQDGLQPELCPSDRPYCCMSLTLEAPRVYEFCAATPPQGWRCEGPE